MPKFDLSNLKGIIEMLTNLNPQKALEEVVAGVPGLDAIIKHPTYLPKDAPPQPGVPYIGIYDGHGGKLEVQVEPGSPVVAIALAVGVDVL
jgi:hypothetical protein